MLKGIWVFGASIAYGAYDTKGGWVQRLRTYLDTKGLTKNYYCEIYNLGIPKGETTDDLKRRILTDAKPRMWDTERLTVISIGINDSALWNGKDGNWVNLDQYVDNLKDIYQKAKIFSNDVFFVGLTLVDESITVPIPWDKRFNYKNSEIEKYNKAMEATAKDLGINFINLIPKLQEVNWSMMLWDGVHPNNEGHNLMFEIIKSELEEKKVI